KVVGSNPAPATKHRKRLLERVAFFVRVGFMHQTRRSELASRSFKRSKDREASSLLQPSTYLVHLCIKG
ncbi:hypothetical protein, partial [Pseudomonas helleri]|uniref:hypothetical protein n=1 Tax=Pseudomonas helleri TaxID=1608996 RepID=UPI001E5C08A2